MEALQLLQQAIVQEREAQIVSSSLFSNSDLRRNRDEL